MTDFLDEKKQEIAARLKELRPLVEEYHRLEAAAAALDGVETPAAAPAARRGRRPSTSKPAGSGSGRGRPKGSGTRSKQALASVTAQPGITIPELAQGMGIAQNYLYRVMPELQKDGLVRKEGRGWYPVEAA
ncbi:Rrf2 family transcriptional regulator [Paraconexibacter antarcticus]|uniref:Rrf2 family transcriptional regulator n=1 Tax=Paraconexibacter antarcticus TaxID=2949664 RepID=A0ABY5DN64_9ACTN|nr:Rrf2 family transcriptional regulator [Paraconexibacter antarcticus]UTI63473.1 Rrf2 family transcriptional regulator [Paraconexibacter antarcticus]